MQPDASRKGMEVRISFGKHSLDEEEALQKKRRYEDRNSASSCTGSALGHGRRVHPPAHPYDVGLYVNSPIPLTDDLKYNLLVKTYTPAPDYDFKRDAAGLRSFRHAWLSQYSPWLCYSSYLKGPFCKYCTIFPQPAHCGRQGAFIIVPFVRYNDFHVCAKHHILSAWHRNAEIDATNFLTSRNKTVTNNACEADGSIGQRADDNHKQLHSILSTIVFCGTHDIPLRGETSKAGNIQSLFAFRVEAGDETLREHLENAPGNACYASAQLQHKLITLCEDALREEIVSAANTSVGFSIIADESAEIAGKEQLPLGVRFVHTAGSQPVIREEFLGFMTLSEWDAASIAKAIVEECTKFGLNLEKLYGQGYDGCSKMAGKEGDVQAIIKRQYPKAVFVHCAGYKLSLVVNALNSVPEIRNSVGTVEAIIRFFCESAKRRSLALSVPLLCETSRTAQCKSLRVFSENFVQIFDQLGTLATTASGETGQEAYQLRCASGTPSFLICLLIMATYSTQLESVTESLQGVQPDMLKAYDRVQELLSMFRGHREKAVEHFKGIVSEVHELADKLGIHFCIPRQCGLQKSCSSAGGSTVEAYFCQSIYIPYLDSVVNLLESRFAPENKAVFSLFSLHPVEMAKMGLEKFKAEIEKISEFYEIDHLEREAVTWFETWSKRKEQSLDMWDGGLLGLLQEAEPYPSIQEAILMALSLPVTSCTTERSFSAMRRVKMWLRSTGADDRLAGLCMMSAHRIQINEHKDRLLQKVIDRFREDNRHSHALFPV